MNETLVVYEFKDISSVHTYNHFDGVKSFYREKSEEHNIHFRGFGRWRNGYYTSKIPVSLFILIDQERMSRREGGEGACNSRVLPSAM